MKTNYFFLIFSFLLFSCSKEDIHPIDEEIITLPEVVTNPVTDFSIFSLTVNGELVTETNSEIIEVGFVVEINETPTINSNLVRTLTQLNNDNTFSFTYESIPSNTDLHIRAYIINTDGVSYGNEIIFTTFPENIYNGNSIYLTNQQEVDNFAFNNYTTVNASIYIEGSGITSLVGLEDLIMIYGDLHIRHTNLTNLQGLDNLKFCGGTLQIESNNNLNSLNGLNQFKKGRHFNIINNSSLIDLYGLDNFEILYNLGDFRIQDNENLESLSGLNNFKTLWDGSLYIMYNSKLSSIEGLSNLNFIRYNIYIIENPLLATLNGLENIKSIKTLQIKNNSSLINLDGINNLETINEGLFIEDNNNLTSISSFENLTQISDPNNSSNIFHLQINNNQNLTNLNGLENITSQEKRVRYEISYNNALSDFCGIKNLISNNYIFNFNIFNNLTNPTSSEIINSCQ